MANKTVSHTVRAVKGVDSKTFDKSLLTWEGTYKAYPETKGNNYASYSEMSIGIKYDKQDCFIELKNVVIEDGFSESKGMEPSARCRFRPEDVKMINEIFDVFEEKMQSSIIPCKASSFEHCSCKELCMNKQFKFPLKRIIAQNANFAYLSTVKNDHNFTGFDFTIPNRTREEAKKHFLPKSHFAGKPGIYTLLLNLSYVDLSRENEKKARASPKLNITYAALETVEGVTKEYTRFVPQSDDEDEPKEDEDE
jgi:hypothetical protein